MARGPASDEETGDGSAMGLDGGTAVGGTGAITMVCPESSGNANVGGA